MADSIIPGYGSGPGGSMGVPKKKIQPVRSKDNPTAKYTPAPLRSVAIGKAKDASTLEPSKPGTFDPKTLKPYPNNTAKSGLTGAPGVLGGQHAGGHSDVAGK